MTFLVVVLAAWTSLAAGDDDKKPPPTGKTPTELPRIPAPDPKATQLPAGFAVAAVATDLTYPSSIEFDDKGAMYVAEAGYNYGDEIAPARVKRITRAGSNQTVTEVVADQLNVATAGLKRPVDVKFAPDGMSLYVVDVGAMTDVPTALGPAPRPFPGTGVVWHIVPAK